MTIRNIHRHVLLPMALALSIGCQEKNPPSGVAEGQGASISEAQSRSAEFAVAPTIPRAGEGRFTKALNERIDGLLAEVANGRTTTIGNAKDRGAILYDWANALALNDIWIHPDLVALAALTSQPNFSRLNPKAQSYYIFAIDNFIADLALTRTKPDAFGPISAKVLKAGRVADYLSVAMTYTVGSEAIEVGGGIVAPNHFRFADFEYQTDNPEAENYVTIRSSNEQAVFAVDEFAAAGQYSCQLHGVPKPRLFFRLVEGRLVRGDTVTVTFGDTRQGSPGLSTVHYSNSALRYPVWVLTAAQEAGGVLHSLPEVPVALAGGPAVAVHGFGPAIAATGETFELSIRTEDRFRNRASADIPARYDISLNGKPFKTLDTRGEVIVRMPVAFDEPGVYRFAMVSEDGAIRGVADPVVVEADPSMRIYWGETHGHTGWAEGLGLVDDYFTFGREDARLNFITLSEHDLWLDLGEWAEMRRAVDRHQRDGEFLTYMGYEWTVDPPFGGHHNVLFRRPEQAVLVGRQYHPALEHLYAGLRRAVAADDVIVVPHAHQPGDWRRSDPDLETLVEVVSYHGTFEWFGKNYLDRGWEVGFIGSSDDHVGSPGYRPRAFRKLGSDNFGGLAAVYAPRLDRDAIFDGLRQRHAYATNGARIILRADMNAQRMGTRLPLDSGVRTLVGQVVGSAEIASLALIKNGSELQSIDNLADTAGAVIELAFHFDSNPRSRRRSFRDSTFQGRIGLQGFAVDSVTAPVAQALNSETEFARLSESGDEVAFRLRSGGRINTVELALRDVPADDAVLSVDLGASQAHHFDGAALETVEFSWSALQGGEVVKVLDANGFNTLTVRRISRHGRLQQQFEFVDDSPAQEGDYYYLRVRQIDGGMAWSSPWWLGQPRRRQANADVN